MSGFMWILKIPYTSQKHVNRWIKQIAPECEYSWPVSHHDPDLDKLVTESEMESNFKILQIISTDQGFQEP